MLTVKPLKSGHLGTTQLQGVYNRLLLVPIVGGACFLRHQLAAVLMCH